MNFTFIFVAFVVALIVNVFMVLYLHSKWYTKTQDKDDLQMHRDVSILQHADVDINNRISKLQDSLSQLKSTVEINEQIQTELPKLKQDLHFLHVKLLDSSEVLANVLEKNNALQRSAESSESIQQQLSAKLQEYIDTNLDESLRKMFEEHKKQLNTGNLDTVLNKQHSEYEQRLAEIAKSRDDVQEKLKRLEYLGNTTSIRELATKLDAEMGLRSAIESVQVGHEKWLKRDFKAVGDGVTDDSKAIESFLNHLLKTGEVGLIESGIFLVSNRVEVNSDENGKPFTVKGLSASATKFTGQGMLMFRDCNTVHVSSVALNRVTMVNCDNCILENVDSTDLHIDFTSNVHLNTITAEWFVLSNVKNVRLEHSTIQNLKVVESQKILLRSIDACNVTYETSNNCTYENSHIMENGLVTVRDCKLVMFENLFFVGNGFDVFDCQYLTITNVTFVVSSRECIFMQGCEFSKIQNCTMHDAECALYLQECNNCNVNNVMVYNQKLPAKVVFQVNKCSFLECKELSVNASDQFDPMTVLLDVVDSEASTFAFTRIINVQIISVRDNCEDIMVLKPVHEPNYSLDDYRLDVTGDTNDVVTMMTMSALYSNDKFSRVDGRKLTKGRRLIGADEEDTDEPLDPNKPLVLKPMYQRKGSIDDNSEREKEKKDKRAKAKKDKAKERARRETIEREIEKDKELMEKEKQLKEQEKADLKAETMETDELEYLEGPVESDDEEIESEEPEALKRYILEDH